MRKMFTLMAFLTLVSFSTVFAQVWVNEGGWPPSMATTWIGPHSIAVDPDGKVWIGDYYNLPMDSIYNGTAWVKTRAIHVFNPDGSEASFSPIKTITVGGVTDSLVGNTNRGMREAADGNILASIFDKVYLIDYKTGEGIAKVQPVPGASLAAAAVDTNGNVFTATVVPGNPINVYTPDLSLNLGQVTDASLGFSRSFEVSADGNTVYWAGYSLHKVYVYSRPDEYTPYSLTDSTMFGFDSESFTWSPDRSVLWASAGSYNDKPNQDPDHVTYYTPGTWYGWDMTAGQIVDSINTTFPTPNDANYRPRGLAFSPDYSTAYTIYFGGTKPGVVKYTKTNITSITVTFRVNMAVQVQKGAFNIGTDNVRVRGSFQTAAGDTANWAGDKFLMTKGASDTIYSVTATFPGSEYGNSYEYKYVINDGGWEGISNRPLTLNSPDITLPVVFFNNESVYIPTVKNMVLFQADMSSYLGTAPGQFNPSTDSLVVMGLAGWDGTYNPAKVEGNRTLAPSISDPTIYQALLTFSGPVGDSTAWKFKAYPDERFGNGGGWETGSNHMYYFIADSQNVNVLTPIVPGLIIFAGDLANSVDVLFQVNMSNAVDFNSKQPVAANTINFVGLKGSIKPLGNWGGNWTWTDTLDAPTYVDTIRTLKPLNDQGLNGDKVAGDNIWSRTITFAAGTPAGNTEFKFGMGYPGVETVVSSSYLDNEMGFGINHNFFLTDGPALELLYNFGVKDPVTGVVKENNTIPTVYSLNQNYPNPFNPSTTIAYSIPATQLVTLKIYNLLGQEVATLVNQEQTAGNYTVKLDASSFASGIYFYSLQAGNFTSTKKMMLMK